MMENRDGKKSKGSVRGLAIGGQLQSLLAEAEGLSQGLKDGPKTPRKSSSASSPMASPRSSAVTLPSPRGSRVGSASKVRPFEDVQLLDPHEQELVGPLFEVVARCMLLPMSDPQSSLYPKEVRDLRDGKEKESSSDFLTRFAALLRLSGTDSKKLLKHTRSLDEETLLQLLEHRFVQIQTHLNGPTHQISNNGNNANSTSPSPTNSATSLSQNNNNSTNSTSNVSQSRRSDQPTDPNELSQWCESELQRVRLLTQQVLERRGVFQGKLVVKVVEAKGLEGQFGQHQIAANQMNSYCAIVVNSGTEFQQREKTETKKKTSEPNWNKEFSFKLSSPITSFKLELHHKDKSKKADVLLSEIGIALVNPEEEKERDEWISLNVSNTNATADVRLQFRYTFKYAKYLRVVRGSEKISSSSLQQQQILSSDPFYIYKLLLRLLLNCPDLASTIATTNSESDALFSETSQWLLDEFALSYGIERSAQTLALLSSLYRCYRPVKSNAKTALKLLQSEQFRLCYSEEQTALLALKSKFTDLIRGYLVDYSEHFESNQPPGSFAQHWQLFLFLINNDSVKIKELLQHSRRSLYEKLGGKSTSVRDLLTVCAEFPKLVENDASHFAPVLAPLLEAVSDVSVTATSELYEHLRADVVRVADQSTSDPNALELLFALTSLHEKLDSLAKKLEISNLSPSLASTSSLLLSSSLTKIQPIDVGTTFFPLILSWLRETSLQSVHWLTEAQQQDGRATVDGGVAGRLIKRYEDRIEYMRRVHSAVRDHPQASVLLLQLAEIFCKSASQFRKIHERLLAYHRFGGIPQPIQSNKLGIVTPTNPSASSSSSGQDFEEVSLGSENNSANSTSGSSNSNIESANVLNPLSTITTLLPLTPAFCSAMNQLEKFRSELDRLCAKMISIMRENLPSQMNESSRLAIQCVEESIGICFREVSSALSEVVEIALKKIVSEMRDSLCLVIVNLLKKSQYDTQIIRKWSNEAGRELDLTSMHFSRAFFDRAFLSPIRSEAAKIFTEVLLSPSRADISSPLSKNQIEILKKLFSELLSFFNEREAAGALVTAKALAHNGDDVSELLSLSERTTTQLIDMHARLESGHNPYKMTAEAERELQLADYCVSIAKTRSVVDNEAKQFLDTLAKNAQAKQQKKDALNAKMKEIRTYFGFSENEFLVEEYSCSSGWLYLTNLNLGFYPMLGAKMILPLKDILKISKESAWLVEALKIQMKNGEAHSFKGPLRGEPASDIPLKGKLLGYDFV